MRKRKQGRTLARTHQQQKALLISLSRGLLQNGRIRTTLARAKELRGFVEPHITRAKKGDMAARRELNKLYDKNVVSVIVDQVAPRYKDRPGGYTRIIKLGSRPSDGAEMALIELV